MRFKTALMGLIFVLSCGIGCTAAEIIQPSEVLETIRRAFLEKNLHAVERELASSPAMDEDQFDKKLNDLFRNFDAMDLDFSVDQTLTDKDKTVIKVFWHRRLLSKDTGQSSLSEGRAQFIFIFAENHWGLYDIQGQSPLQ